LDKKGQVVFPHPVTHGDKIILITFYEEGTSAEKLMSAKASYTVF
jgi:hypothetical protein